VRLASVESLAGFTETTGETVVDQGELEDALERVDDGHLAAGTAGGGIDGNFDFFGGGGGGRLLFSFGLGAEKDVLVM